MMRSAPLLHLFLPPEHESFMAAGCCVQIVEATGRMATKTVISASGDGISKITGAIVIVQDEQHVAALKSKAAAANFVAYTKSELANCGDPRALSFSTDFNLLFIDTSAVRYPFPVILSYLNPFPAPGHRVGAVHGRRDTRTATGGAPEPARQPPMASRDPLNVRNNFHTKKKITHTRNFRAQCCRLQELRYAGLDTSIRLTTRPLRPIASSFWPSRANLMTMAGTKKIGASPMPFRPT